MLFRSRPKGLRTNGGELALSCRSFIAETNRLQHFGDKILDFVVTELLLEKYPRLTPGGVTVSFALHFLRRPTHPSTPPGTPLPPRPERSPRHSRRRVPARQTPPRLSSRRRAPIAPRTHPSRPLRSLPRRPILRARLRPHALLDPSPLQASPRRSVRPGQAGGGRDGLWVVRKSPAVHELDGGQVGDAGV